MTTFHMVRHGPTHEKTFVGWRDVPADLSDTQALARLDAALPRDALLISSDLIRAVHTADAIGMGRQRLPHDPDLREFDFGDWDGRHHTEVSESHPDLSRAFWETPATYAPRTEKAGTTSPTGWPGCCHACTRRIPVPILSSSATLA